jgi:ATP:ADP antiporter, AAA family
MPEKEKEFGFIRSILWPVHKSEVKKVTSILGLMFFLCGSYNILRNLKDTIILTAKHSGAEVIPFLKVWGMLPGAILATLLYTRLARRFSKETVFYITLGLFLSYFLFFAFFLHPNSDSLHLDSLGTWMTANLPAGFKGLIAMIRNWTFTSFYVISELWAPVMLGMLFWGFVNDHTKVSEAKRTYGILNIGSNLAPILGGGIGILCAQAFSFSVSGGSSEEAWSQTLINLTLTLTVLGLTSAAIYYWINRNILNIEGTSSKESVEMEKKEKEKISVRESIRYILKSKYLTCLALIFIGYNIAINVTDVLWKAQLKSFFTDPNEMLAHMNAITIGIGVIGTTGGALFSFMINRVGWTFTALLTPAVMSVMAIGFFVFLFAGDALTPMSLALLGTTPLALTVYFGSLQYALSKGCKYSVFDASKELAFLPLPTTSKTKGKAAIDGLGSAVGKSGASITYQGLIIGLGSVAASTPYVAVILFIVLAAWIYSVFSLGALFKKENDAAEAIASSKVTS